MSSNKASRKNESGTDCQPENSQHTTGCFILTIFRPHLTPPLPRVPTGVKAKRCCGSFRLACHFVPCHRQNFFFFFLAKTSSLEKCLLRLARGRGQRCLLPPAPCSMFYVPRCKATGPPVFNSIPHREFRIFFSFLPEALGEKMMMSGQYNPVNTSRLAYQQTTAGTLAWLCTAGKHVAYSAFHYTQVRTFRVQG